MKQQLSAYLDNTITVLLFLVAGLTPLLFLNLTTEFFEMPKLTFLVVMTILLTGLWMFSWIIKGKVVITRTPLDLPLILLLAIILISTYFSATRYPAIYGNFPRVHGSAISWVCYILLYFVTVSHLKNLAQIKTFLYVLMGASVGATLLSLLAFFGLYLPFDFTKALNFSPTGSTFSTLSMLILLLPLTLLSILSPNKYLPQPAAIALASLFGVSIALMGSISTYIVSTIAVALTLFISKPNQIKRMLPLFLIPVVITLVILGASLLPLPGNVNKLQQQAANFPKEIQLPFNISWKVSASSFRDAPFIGTGPSTYLFNFTAYKPAEFNTLRFWNFSFDSAFNEFLQVFGTLGILGLLALVFLSLTVLNNAWRNLSFEGTGEGQDSTQHILLPALAISGILAILLLMVHATTLVSIVVTLFILAALMASQKGIRGKVSEFSMGIKAQTSDNNQFDLLPIIIFIAFTIFGVSVLYNTYRVVNADYHHRLALNQANKNGTLTYQNLQRAEQLNDKIDLYRVDLAQTNFALANAIAAQKGPTEASPGGSLTDQDKQTIQILLSQSINEGRAAVALSPRSARNWEVLASVYRNITGVAQNALQFSLDSYGRAIQNDPLNPLLRLNVGGIYYSIKNYDLAIRFFSDAANLKPDYANAYYNLSVALRDKGDLNNASLAAQQVVSLLQKDTNNPDYKTAAAYLADLKARIATGSAQTAGQAAPASQTNSALQNQQPGVQVPDLNNPPQPATPEAVKKNPDAKLPSPAPSGTPAATANP